MQIDIEKLNDLTTKADGIFLGPDGEEALVQLLEIQTQVENAIVEAKQKLEAKAMELDPNFSSIQGDRIKVSYRFYGSKYYLEDDKIDQVPGELYKTTTRYSIDAKALGEYLKEKPGLPVGIKEVERKKSLTFSLKETK